MKFIFHASIDKIRNTYESNKKFSFQQVTKEHLRQVILRIDGSKATPVGNIPADMLKVTLEIRLLLKRKSLICCLKMDVKTCRSSSYLQEKR